MQISVNDLDGIKQKITQILGEGFFAELMQFNLDGFAPRDGINRENRDQAAESAKLELIAHPLAIWLQCFEYDLQQSKILGQLHISETSARLLNFSANLIDGQKIENFDLLIPDLRLRSKFQPTAYELHVACQYLALDYSVRFVPTSPKTGEKTPDLVVEKNGYVMQVECKSTKDESLFQDNIFIQNAVSLDKAMERKRLNLFIKIHPRLSLSGENIEKLFAEIKAELLKEEKRTSFLHGAVHVEWSNVDTSQIIACTELKDFQSVSYKPKDRLDSGYASFNGVENTDGKIDWSLERGSEIRHFFEIEIFQAIKNKLKKANKQLFDNIPAVIHIEVPCKTTASFLQIIDQNFDLIRDHVNSYGKIRAVVLECSTIDRHMEDGGSPVSLLSYVISNLHTEAFIPRELQIAGTIDLGYQVDATEGTIAIEMIKPEDPRIFLSRPLVVHSAPHGDEQILIWLKNENTLRFEVISNKGKRQIAECSVSWQKIPDEFQIIASWGIKVPFLYIGAIKPMNFGQPAA